MWLETAYVLKKLQGFQYGKFTGYKCWVGGITSKGQTRTREVEHYEKICVLGNFSGIDIDDKLEKKDQKQEGILGGC